MVRFQRGHFPGMFPEPSWGPSAISGNGSEATFQVEGAREGGFADPEGEGEGGREPGSLIFPSSGLGPERARPSLTNEPHDVGVVKFLHADSFAQEVLQL